MVTPQPLPDATCAMPAAMLALAAAVGAALTAGWLPVAIVRATRDSDARRWWKDRPRR